MRKVKLKVAVLSSLYPNARQPRHGIFVEQRLLNLIGTGRIEAKVVAPVPWFWSTHPRYGRYAELAAVPYTERRYGLSIYHPRYPVIPKIGMTLGPMGMAMSAARVLSQIRKEGFDFDLIDSHYFFPDGVAASHLARMFDRPFTVTARGSDINTIAKMQVPRLQIRCAAKKAGALIAVSTALADEMRSFCDDPSKVVTLRNGVDLGVFSVRDQARMRDKLGLQSPVWLCVGNLVEGKGVAIALSALSLVPDATLLIVGTGPEEAKLRGLADKLGIATRVVFVGAVAHAELSTYYNAADALIMPTRSEGMPNVVLEAMACGTAVIATAVGGIPEILTEQVQGRLLVSRTPDGIRQAWEEIVPAARESSARRERRELAENFDWSATSMGQLEVFDRVVNNRTGDLEKYAGR